MLGEPQAEPEPDLGRRRDGALGALGQRVELQQVPERTLQLVGGPGTSLVRQLVRDIRVEAHRPDEGRRALAFANPVYYFEQLPNPPMDLGQQERGRRLVEQPIEEPRRPAHMALAEGVQEGPCRTRDGFGNERPDVVNADLFVGPVEAQLVALARSDLALSPPVDVALGHERAHPGRKLLGRTATKADTALAGTLLD